MEQGTVYEGLQVNLHPAPFWKRFFAYATDMALVTCVLYLVIIALVVTGGISFAFLQIFIKSGGSTGMTAGAVLAAVLFVLALLAVYHGYFIYFESRKGYTPGKKLFGLQVTSTKGGRLTAGQCVLRDMMRYVDCALILPGLLTVLLTSRSQRLGDLMAGTLVIHSVHRENSSNFLYLKQEDYLLWHEAWSPTPVPLDVCRDYLEFAYPVFCQGKLPHYNDIEKWQDISLRFVHPKTADPIEQQALLLFFAELCFQTFQGETRRSHA